MEEREVLLQRERLEKTVSYSKLLVEKAEASQRNANQAVQRARELKARLANRWGQRANRVPQRSIVTDLACRTQP